VKPTLEAAPELDYAGHVQALRADSAELAEEVASFRGVEDVLQWMKRRDLTRTAVDLLAMDEFHYDFLIQLGPGGRWLAFGVT
jgi:hypothetical protein